MAALSRQTGVSIGIDADLPSIRAPAVRGAHDVGEVLNRLLAGTSLTAVKIGATAWRIRRTAPHVARPIAAAARPPANWGEDAVVVTATKQAWLGFALPQAVTVLTLARSDRYFSTRDTAYVSSEVEGLNLTALGPGRNRLFLRGVADSPFNNSNQSPVAVVLDGARLTYSAPDPDLRLVDVKRVELLKSPQGALYGVGALGGVYHVVTERADVDQFSGSTSAGVDVVLHGQVGGSGAAVVNLPLAPGRMALRLVGYTSHEPGWIDTGRRANGNFNKVAGGRASLGVEPGGGWRIDLDATVQLIDTPDSQYTYAPSKYWRAPQLPEQHDNDLDHASVHVSGKIGGVETELVGGYTTHEVADTFDATIGAGAFGLAKPRLFADARTYRLGEAELRLNGNLGGWSWLAGLSHVEAREHDVRSLDSFVPGPDLIIDRASRTTRESGLFGKVYIPVTDRLAMDFGGRAYQWEQHGDFTAGSQALRQTTSRWNVSPTAALSWRARADRLLYLCYGAASRPGVLDFSWRGKVRQLAGDSVSTLTLGWREQLPGGGTFETSGFISWWNNIQTDHLLPNGLIAAHNAGNARIRGLELTLDLPVRRNWRISTGATLQDADLVSAQHPISAGYRYGHLPAIPDLTLRASLARTFHVRTAPASVKLSLRYVGPASLSLDPALNRSMGQVLESRLDTSMAFGKTRLDLRLTNLLNRLDNRFAYGNPFRMAVPQYTPQRPFGASLTVTREF